MSWPLPQDFNEAVQNPAIAFSDPDLMNGQTVVGPTGLPLPRSGNFADVYQIRGTNGRDWAMKCFTRTVTGLEQRYKKLDEALKKAGLPFAVGFTFLNEGVMVLGAWRPAVKMEWVDGLQLNQAARVQAGSPKVLDALTQMWSRLCKKLRDSGIAHADLQHGNVLLVAGSKPGAYSLKLIDYDGMFVPSLANTPSGESGHANYQHPQRAAKQVYSPDLDRFPHLVIATALKGLAVLGAKLWEKYDTGDNLLFTEEDFKNPAASALMKELWLSNDPGLQALVGHLAIACGKPIPQTPWLDVIAPDGVPFPLTPDQARTAAAALGVPPPPSAVVVPVNASEYGVDPVAPPPLPAPVSAFSAFDANATEVAEPRPRKRTREAEELDDGPRYAPKKKSLAIPLAIGGVLTLALAGVAGVMLLGDKKPTEQASQKEEPKDDDKEKAKPPVKEKDKERPKDEPLPPRKDPIIPPVSLPEPGSFSFDPAGVPELSQRWQGLMQGNPSGAKFTATGEYVVAKDASAPNAVRVFAARTGTKLAGFTEGETALVDFACLSDGNVASYHADQPFAIVWNPATGKAVGKIPVRSPGFATGPKLFDVSPDGRFVVVGHAAPLNSRPDEFGRISLSDAESGKELLNANVLGPKFRWTDAQFIVADIDQIRYFRLPDGKPVRVGKNADATRNTKLLACSADGNLVLHPGRGRDPHVIDCKSGRVVAVFPNRFSSSVGAMSDDGRLVALCSFADKQNGELSSHLEVLDMTAKRLIGRYILANNAVDVNAIAFAPDNSAMVISRTGRRVQVIDLPKSGAVAVLPKMKDPDPMLNNPMPNAQVPGEGFRVKWSKEFTDIIGANIWYSPDGKHVFINSNNSSQVDAFELATGAKVAGFKGPVNTMAWQKFTRLEDGRVFGVSGAGTAHLFDFQTGEDFGSPIKPEWMPSEKEKSQTTYSISPDGKYAFAARVGQRKQVGNAFPEHEDAPFKMMSLADGTTYAASEWRSGFARFTADSKHLIFYDDRGLFVRKRVLGGDETVWKFPSPGPLSSVTDTSADGSVVLFHGSIPNARSTLHLLNGKDGRVIRSLGGSPVTYWGAVRPDGKQVCVVRYLQGQPNINLAIEIQVLEVETGAVLREAKVAIDVNRVRTLSISPDLTSFAFCYRDTKQVHVCEFKNAAVAVVPKMKDPDPTPPPKPKDPPKIERVPQPDGAAIAKAEMKLRGLLKEDYAKKLPAERKALAVKLLGLADDSGDDPALRFVMFRDARDIAIEVFETPMAMQALDGLLRHYVVDADAIRLAAFEKIRDTAGNNTALKAVVDLAMSASDVAMAADKYDFATKYAQTAQTAAKRAALPAATLDEIEAQLTKSQRGAEAFKPVAEALLRLNTKADDAAAAYVVGRYRCFVQGRWDEGLPLLAKGASYEMKAAATLDLAAPKAGPADPKLAEAWWQAAEVAFDADKLGARFRARHWYARSLPALTGVAKLEAESRLAFTSGGVDYRDGLVAEFTAKVPAILQGKKARLDQGIDFNAGEFKAEGTGVATDLSVRWTGAIAPQRPGRYRFAVTATDPVIVRIDGRTVIDTNAKGGRRDALVALPDRPVSLVVEFKCINTEKHGVKLLWSIPGSDVEEAIPAEVFVHDKKQDAVLGKLP